VVVSILRKPATTFRYGKPALLRYDYAVKNAQFAVVLTLHALQKGVSEAVLTGKQAIKHRIPIGLTSGKAKAYVKTAVIKRMSILIIKSKR
jgi:hypothetical protein